MERLTYDFALGGNHCWQVKGADNLECREVCERQGDDGCKTCPIAKAFDRLAAYEDTELEPEEIELLAKQRGLYVDACGELPLKRIRELAQADRDGRCVVLPCKIDDDVYINLFGRTLDATVISISELASTPTYKAMYGIRLCYIFKADDVGRTVFLTREAAEEALKAREQE